MRFSTLSFGALALAATATPAFAEDTAPPPEITINATAAVVSDYRFRGVSQTDTNPALQGSITITHASGFYVSAWGSSVDNYVTASLKARQEIDLIAGYSKTIGGTKLDGGVLFYYYPQTHLAGDASSSNFFEPYVDISHTFGPVSAKATVNYAPKQKAMKLNQTNGKAYDNVYVAGDFSAAIPSTPFGLTAHIAHNFGPSWLATSYGKPAQQNGYTDWSLGATVTYKMLTLGVAYVDTDAKFLDLTGTRNISKSGLVASLTASF